ncbi:nuclease HARBI1 [Pyrus ussuriensis x Pyrus communis]|uniref:Nuclease HARBI1 n=1 Tax=Pyrus ussuriensis x Pyrus communis TaxID=2448454 RepID=A0A5N5FFA7_9ROSA|nr:nuclease HARBI1 [Pyrus ussuriensis x Pyrus communis]
MGRASHSRRVVQAMAQICRPSRSGNLDRSRQRRGMELLDDYFVPNSAFPDTYFRRRFRMERHLFNKIMIAVCNHDSYFVQKKDAFGAMGLLPEQKITVALRMLAYGTSADQVDKITRMGKSTILESLMRFCGAIESIYTAEYLRKPTNMDLERLLKKAEMRGFPGMIGSIDCMHWTWKNCPSAWQGAYGDRKGAKSIILEAADVNADVTWPQALELAIPHGPGARVSTFTRACPRLSLSTGPRALVLSPVPRACAHAGLALKQDKNAQTPIIFITFPTEPEASELPKGLVLGRDGEIHIRITPLGDVGSYNPPPLGARRPRRHTTARVRF